MMRLSTAAVPGFRIVPSLRGRSNVQEPSSRSQGPTQGCTGEFRAGAKRVRECVSAENGNAAGSPQEGELRFGAEARRSCLTTPPPKLGEGSPAVARNERKRPAGERAPRGERRPLPRSDTGRLASTLRSSHH